MGILPGYCQGNGRQVRRTVRHCRRDVVMKFWIDTVPAGRPSPAWLMGGTRSDTEFRPIDFDKAMSIRSAGHIEAFQSFLVYPVLDLRVLLPSVRCGLFDQSCNLFRLGYVDRVTGAGDFDLVTVGSCGVPALDVGVDGSIRSCYQRPAWFASPPSSGDHRFEIVGEV